MAAGGRRDAGALVAVAVTAALAGAGFALLVDAPRLAASSGVNAPAPMPAAKPLTGSSVEPAPARRRLAREAQALVSVRPADLGYRLRLAGPREGVRAQADLDDRTVTLFLDGNDAAHRVAHDLAHELGHAYDDLRLSTAQRRAWLRARGARDVRWYPGGDASDYASGAGDFAEVFARCHAASPEFRSRVAPPPADACGMLPDDARDPRPR